MKNAKDDKAQESSSQKESADTLKKGEVLVVHRGEEESYWQPKPANGYLSVCVAPHLVKMDSPFIVVVQSVPAGGVIREHGHDRHEEVLHVTAGSGKAILDGVEHRVKEGTTLFFGKNRRHSIINDGDSDLVFVGFMTPNGIEAFFSEIGRVRKQGEETPEPFERPSDVAEIEARTVFSKQ